MKLYFKNMYGKLKIVGKIDGRMKKDKIENEAFRMIRGFCNDHNYMPYYYRVWEGELEGRPATVFDVGSHSEFFYTVPPIRR